MVRISIHLKACFAGFSSRKCFFNHFPILKDRANLISPGIDAEVLALKWPNGTIPSELTRFETRARKQRYQTIGKACAADDIGALFLGHHLDDNVETTLVRLSQGHKRMGLAGFDDISPIPECQGLFGVSESGDFTSVGRMRSQNYIPGNAIPITGNSEGGHRPRSKPMFISTGGVYLYRPFRSFLKSRLLATCHANKVPYVTDSTNEDHTLTVRNTVRQLLNSDDLPIALRRPSLIHLMEASADEANDIQVLTEGLLSRVQIVHFDTRAGILLVKFPLSDTLDDIESHNYRDLVRARVLRSLADFVSPYPDRKTPLEQFRSASSKIFVDRAYSASDPDTFTVGGVLWQPMKYKSNKEIDGNHINPSIPGSFTTRSQNSICFDTPQEPNIWMLSRRPLSQISKKKAVINFSIQIPDSSQPPSSTSSQPSQPQEPPQPSSPLSPSPPTTEIADKAESAEEALSEEHTQEPITNTHLTRTPWTDWQLWDNRFWLRIHAVKSIPVSASEAEHPITRKKFHVCAPGSEIPIILRPLDPKDSIWIRRCLHDKGWRVSRLNRNATDTDRDTDSDADADAETTGTDNVTSMEENNQEKGSEELQPQQTTATQSKSSPPKQPYMTPQDFKSYLTKVAPGKTRFTIPALALDKSKITSDLASEEVPLFALPSALVPLPARILVKTPTSDGKFEYISWKIKWEMRYKWIDPSVVRYLDWLMPLGDQD